MKRGLGLLATVALVGGFLALPTVANATPAPVDTTGWYTITSKATGLVVDVRHAATYDQTPIQQFHANGSNAQKFRFVANGDGTYRVLSALSDTQVWDVARGEAADGSHVQTYTWANVPQQKWSIVAASSGHVSFRPAHAPHSCLDVPHALNEPGRQLWIYACNGTAAQEYQLTRVGNVTPPVTPPPPPVTPPVTPPTAGACTHYTGAKAIAIATIGSWKLPICGPRPTFDGSKWRIKLLAHPGATFTYLGFESSELAARWLHHWQGVAAVAGKPSQFVDRYVRAYPQKFTWAAHGRKGVIPKIGDVLSFSNFSNFSTDTGHTAVVVSVRIDSKGNGVVRIAEQNHAGKTGYRDLTVRNWKFTNSGFLHVKWLTLK